MQVSQISILLIEDDPLHAKVLKFKLNSIGYHDLTIFSSFTEASTYLDIHFPDLIITDYYLDDNKKGTDLIKEHMFDHNTPVIFISSFYESSIINDILKVKPMYFLDKNVNDFDFKKAIELSISRHNKELQKSIINDYLLVRHTKGIVKINIHDVIFINVDGKYLELNASNKKYLIRSTLNSFMGRLPSNFIKVNQTYIVNIDYMTAIHPEKSVLFLNDLAISYTRLYRKNLFNAISVF